MALEQRQFEFRADDGDGRTLSALAVPYGVSAEIHENGRTFTETVSRGACASAVSSGGVPVLWSHERSQPPIAVSTSLEERDDGLHLTARLLSSPLAEAVREGVAAGAIRGASIGFSVGDGDDEWRGDQRTINRLTLREISITPFPAYATAVGVRSAGTGLTRGQRAYQLRELELKRIAAQIAVADAAAPPTADDAAAALQVLAEFIDSYQSGGGSGMPPGP